MEKTDFVNWKSMFLSTLRIYKLAPIVLEAEVTLMLSTSEVNPLYEDWTSYDQLVLV